MNTHTRHDIGVLLVEDNPADARLTREAFQDVGSRSRLEIVTDGAEALSFVRAQGPHAQRLMPDLILLDLNIPRVSGWDVLRELKTDPDLRHIPIVVLTTSDSPRDVSRTYSHHANSFITKPSDYHEFVDVIRAVDAFWLTASTLPRNGVAR